MLNQFAAVGVGVGRVKAQQLVELPCWGQGGLERALDPGNRGYELDFSSEGQSAMAGRHSEASILRQHLEEDK